MSASVSSAKVQHLTKKSSEELLRKFSDDAPPRKRVKRTQKRTQKRTEIGTCGSPSGGSNTLVEKKSLLPPVTRRSGLLRQLGITRSQLKARDIRNKSILVTIEKTWRKTMESASKVLLDKRYNRHRRLINDIV